MSTTKQSAQYKYDIFISYASDDYPFVVQIVDQLEKFKYKIWIDKDRLNKHPAQDFNPHVKAGIDQSALILYVHSPASDQSEYIQNVELPYMRDTGKDVLVYPYQCDQKLMRFEKHPWLKKIEHVVPELVNPETKMNNGLYDIRVAVQRYFKHLTTTGVYNKLETTSGILLADQVRGILVYNKEFIWAIPESKKQTLESVGFYTQRKAADAFKEVLLDFLHKNCPEITDVQGYLEKTAEETADDFISKLEGRTKDPFNGPMLGVSDIKAQRSADGKEVHSLTLVMYGSDYFTFKMMSKLYAKLKHEFPEKNLFNINNISDIPRYAPFLCSLGMGGFLLRKDADGLKPMWILRGKDCEADSLYHFSYDETVSVKDLDSSGQTVDLYHSLYRGIKEELGLDEYHLTDQGGIFEIGVILTETRIELELFSYAVLDDFVKDSFDQKLEGADDSKLEISKYYFWDFDDYKLELTPRDHILTPESLALIQRLEIRNNENRLLLERRPGTFSHIGEKTHIGLDVSIDDFVVIGKACRIGNHCKIHYFSHIDDDVVIGNHVKIQNNVMIPHGVTLEDGVFVGPSVVFTNDKHPRSVSPEGKLKGADDWTMTPTSIKEGASLGGGAVIVCGVTIGRWAMVGAGAVVTKDVPDYALVVGCPAKVVGKVNEKGEVVKRFQV